MFHFGGLFGNFGATEVYVRNCLNLKFQTGSYFMEFMNQIKKSLLDNENEQNLR